MRKLGIAVGLAAAVMGTSFAAQANEVAVVDWQQALMNTTAAKRSINQLRNQLGNQPQQVESLGQRVQQLQDRLQRDGSTMSESARNNLIKQLQTQGTEFEQKRDHLEQVRQQTEQNFLQQARPRLQRAMQSVIRAHHVDVLIDRSAVLYAPDALDLTNEVTAAYNRG